MGYSPSPREIVKVILLLAIAAAMIFAMLESCASAHDADEPFAAWYNSLKQNGTDISCCSQHDCQEVDYRIGPSAKYQAWIENGWVDIPEDRVLTRDNPVGRGILCRSQSTGTIWCFIPGDAG